MTPQEVAASVAADIRRLGHAQDTFSAVQGSRCCLVNAPTFYKLTATECRRYRRVLAKWIGVPPTTQDELIWWNDTHTTADVLAALDGLAAT